ncbi:hypothetical protein KIPB_013258, partial [Kipferlia bialata]
KGGKRRRYAVLSLDVASNTYMLHYDTKERTYSQCKQAYIVTGATHNDEEYSVTYSVVPAGSGADKAQDRDTVTLVMAGVGEYRAWADREADINP